MKLFLDTNVFVASLTDEPGRGQAATEVMNTDNEFITSVLNLMELRTVLAKKKKIERPQVEETLEDIAEKTEITHSTYIRLAESFQQDTLLYPMDALISSIAGYEAELFITFDTEILEIQDTNDRVLTPEGFLAE